MGEGRGAAGLTRDATVSLFRPARNTILLLLGFASIAAISFGLSSGPPLALGFVLRLAMMFVAALLLAFVQFRDLLFALGAVLGGLPGAAALFAGTTLVATAMPAGLLVAFVFSLGFATALYAGDRFVVRIIEGEESEPAAIGALSGDRYFLIAVALVAAAPLVAAFGGPGMAASVVLAAANVFAVLSAWFAVPLVGSLIPVGEDFIARANRAHEDWMRRLFPLAAAARAPWAWSVSGILLVFLTLSLFGSASMRIAAGKPEASEAACAGGLLIVGAVFAARDARRAVAVWAAVAAALCLAGWGLIRWGGSFDNTLMLMSAELLAICFVPVAVTASRAARSAREDTASRSEAGVLEGGSTAAVGMIAATAFVVPWSGLAGAAGATLAFAFAACGALAFQPALATVLEALVPRRKTVRERYRLK